MQYCIPWPQAEMALRIASYEAVAGASLNELAYPQLQKRARGAKVSLRMEKRES
jgi:hypothetical protein